MKKIYALSIILAGIFWGTIGVFAKVLTQFGFNSFQNSTIRLVSAAIMLFIINRNHLKIKAKDLWMFALLGTASLFSMSFVYFQAIKYTSLSLAAILLYTAPIMVTIMACVFYHEKISALKISALVFAFLGIVLISGFDKTTNVTPVGIIYGLLSALAYSLYSIIGKFILKKYSTKTTITYAFIFAGIVSLFVCDFDSFSKVIVSCDSKLLLILTMIGMGAFSAAIPYTLYTIGLNHIPAGKASILACVEPLTATLVGVMFFNEKLGVISVIGIIFILCAVTALSFSKKN